MFSVNGIVEASVELDVAMFSMNKIARVKIVRDEGQLRRSRSYLLLSRLRHSLFASNKSPLALLTLFLICIAAIRVFYMVVHDPMFGYANQFDMGRTAACIDLWPELPGGPRDIAYFDAPIEKHLIIKVPSQSCYPSMEVAFDTLVIALANVLRYFSSDDTRLEMRLDMRMIGTLKALLLMTTVCVIHLALRSRPRVACVHAAIVALVIVDPLDTLYLNTLYGEFFAVFGAYVAVAAIVALVIDDEQPTRRLLLFSIGVLCLAFSRMQHLLLPVFFIVVLGLLKLGGENAFRSRRERCAAVFVIVGLTIAAASAIVTNLRFAERNPVFHYVNINNALFGALLPASNEPAATVQALHLPVACALLANAGYFQIAGRGLKEVCPEVQALSPLQLLQVFATQPTTLVTAFGRALMLSSGWRIRYVGEVAHKYFAQVPSGPLGIAASFDAVDRKLGFNGHAIFWILPLWAGLIAGGSLLCKRVIGGSVALDRDVQLERIVLCCLAVIETSLWASAIFGDGYSELARHLHLGIITSLVSWLILIVVAIYRRPFWPVIVVLILTSGSVIALRGLPLTMGALSEPEEDRMIATANTFGGWIVAPDHVVAVEIEQEGHLLTRVSVVPSVALSRVHPFNDGRRTFEFQTSRLALTPAFAPNRPISLYAVRDDGGRQRVDIRYPCASKTGC